jgi:hypothetical protein
MRQEPHIKRDCYNDEECLDAAHRQVAPPL